MWTLVDYHIWLLFDCERTHSVRATKCSLQSLFSIDSGNYEDRKQSKSWLVSWLVLWAQSATKEYIRADHKLHSISKYSFRKSFYHKYFFFFLAHLYSAGTQHRNLHPTGWSISFCGPSQEHVLATANTGKNWERFWKKCSWIDRKGTNKQGGNPWQ